MQYFFWDVPCCRRKGANGILHLVATSSIQSIISKRNVGCFKFLDLQPCFHRNQVFHLFCLELLSETHGGHILNFIFSKIES